MAKVHHPESSTPVAIVMGWENKYGWRVLAKAGGAWREHRFQPVQQ